MTYIGCFIDGGTRDLPARVFSDGGLMTNERCAAHCIGFAYSATQVSAAIMINSELFDRLMKLLFIDNLSKPISGCFLLLLW